MSGWYVFFVETRQEQTACNFLNKLFNVEKSVAFYPQIKFIFKRSGLISKELKPMFQGYVFVDTVLDEKTFITLAYQYARFSKCIFKLLSNGIDYMKLPEHEKNYLLGFLDEEYAVEESKGFIVGDRTFITSGPLKNRESMIKKINRHKRYAEIELEFFGNPRRVRVPLEILSKSS